MDMSKFQSIANQTNENSSQFSEMVDKVVVSYCSDLDELMRDLKDALTQKEAITTNAVERYYAELTNMLYFMVDKIERLNVFADMSKAQSKEAYNKAYLQFSGEKDEKGKSVRTINENVSLAENASSYEATVNTLYDHAYKTLKMKIDMGLEMVSTLKHILKKRINEDYLSKQIDDMKSNVEEQL